MSSNTAADKTQDPIEEDPGGLSFAMDVEGSFSVRERGEETESGWSSVSLVSAVNELHMRLESEEGFYTLSLSGHHVTNEETDRTFHASLDAPLSRRQLHNLKRAIAALLKLETEE